LEGVRTKQSKKNPSGAERYGLWKCYVCHQQFTVLSATVLKGSHVPLHKLLQLIFLLNCCRRTVSMLQISKTLELNYWTVFDLVPALKEFFAKNETSTVAGVNQ
jgi:transposase-like protein